MTDAAMGKAVSWADEVVRPGGRLDAGIVRFPDAGDDRNVAYYRTIGGSRIAERSHVPFAMTTLDTPILHRFLDAIAPADLDAPIVDVGGGDGRNALPWLERGYRRVVVVDVAGQALVRLRSRIASRSPEWLERILLIEGDARDLPLRDGCASAVQAIESLYYLNEDYASGLRECARVLAPDGRMLLVERDTEGALIMQLLYFGISALLRSHAEGAVWDGPEGVVRSRSFTERELRDELAANGLDVLEVGGTSLLALVLGWMNGREMLAGAQAEAAAVRELLLDLGEHGRMRRCHVAVARHAKVQ